MVMWFMDFFVNIVICFVYYFLILGGYNDLFFNLLFIFGGINFILGIGLL